MGMPERRSIFWASLAFMAIPMAGYLWVFKTYAINMPYLDDYDVVLGWMHQFLSSNTLHAKFYLLFQQHFEHRIVFDHLIELLCFLIFHKINFIFLSFVGSVGLFGIVALLLYAGRNAGLSCFELIPVPFLLLAWSQHELIGFAMASLQQYWQLFFDLASLIVLTRFQTKLGLAAAGVLGVAASFSGGGGMSVFPVGFLYLLVSRRWRFAAFWSILAAATYYLYFVLLNYQSQLSDMFQHAYAWENPLDVVEFFVQFMGNAGHSMPEALIFGGIIIVMGGLLSVWHFCRQGQPLIYVLLFVSLSAFLVSISRALFGLQVSLTSRYTIYGLLNLALVYIMLISAVQKNLFRRLCAVSGIILWIAVYWSWIGPALTGLRHDNALEQNGLITNFTTPNAAAELQTAMREGVFYPEVLFRHVPRQVISNARFSAAWNVLFFDVYRLRPDLGTAFPLNKASSYASLLHWAITVSPNDPAYSTLNKLQPDYVAMLDDSER